MGCCCSSNEDSGYSDVDADERTPILTNTTINIPPHSVTLISSNQSPGTEYLPNGGGTNHHQDHQSALINILEQTASEFIVCNNEPENVEYQEQKSRSALYRDRLSSCLGGPTRASLPRSPHSLPAGVPSPNIVLSAPTPSRAELEEVCLLAHEVAQAVRSMKATGKEKLVVNLSL